MVNDCGMLQREFIERFRHQQHCHNHYEFVRFDEMSLLPTDIFH